MQSSAAGNSRRLISLSVWAASLALLMLQLMVQQPQDGKRQFKCKDADGNDVDWFIAIKGPGNYKYGYISPDRSQWDYNWDIRSQGPVYHTLQQAFSHKDATLAYNDKHIGNINTRYDAAFGHMKGVFMFPDSNANAATGFWLLHTIPGFPNFANDAYEYPTFPAGNNYGQTFICITASKNQLRRIVSALSGSKPRYYWGIPLPADQPNSPVEIKTNGGKRFQLHFRPKFTTQHGPEWDYDLYEEISTNLRKHLWVQSWLFGNNADTNARMADTGRVKTIANLTFFGQTWPSSRDHSKWCVTFAAKANWVCLGDLNRRQSHSRQGGCALCLEDKTVRDLFRAAVLNIF